MVLIHDFVLESGMAVWVEKGEGDWNSASVTEAHPDTVAVIFETTFKVGTVFVNVSTQLLVVKSPLCRKQRWPSPARFPRIQLTWMEPKICVFIFQAFHSSKPSNVETGLDWYIFTKLGSSTTYECAMKDERSMYAIPIFLALKCTL